LIVHSNLTSSSPINSPINSATYLLLIDSARNYHRLDDVTSRWLSTKRDEDRYKLTASVRVTSDAVENQLRRSVWNRSAADQLMAAAQTTCRGVELIELNQSLKRLAGVETTIVSRCRLDNCHAAVKVKVSAHVAIVCVWSAPRAVAGVVRAALWRGCTHVAFFTINAHVVC
jgi:hypothetical protein